MHQQELKMPLLDINRLGLKRCEGNALHGLSSGTLSRSLETIHINLEKTGIQRDVVEYILRHDGKDIASGVGRFSFAVLMASEVIERWCCFAGKWRDQRS